ncbi:MAG: family 20 glycosylhydrolase [Bacteroides sp.]|nr:family 20 glycosylhydrolase [Bacteroides sp.]
MIILSNCLSISASDINLLPMPQQYKQLSRSFTAKQLSIVAPDDVRAEATNFCNDLQLKVADGCRNILKVEMVSSLDGIPINEREAYKLTVTSRSIDIRAISADGVYWALQTLRQLSMQDGNRIRISGCEITDWPAFRYRGLMMDVSRHFISLDELKREVATLSHYKMNVFHWHLTDSEAWRLESKLFPMLTDSCNATRDAGRYYTVDEAKEFARFCKEHHVLLIPEIEMPGHSAAFTRAFRHDMQSPEGMTILKLLIDEVCEVFADEPYLHIGTEEVKFTNPDFVPEMTEYIRSKGKKVAAWNPGWTYRPGEVDMTHLWSYRGKAQPGIPAVDLRYNYLNHFDTFADIVGLYTSRIYGQPQGSDDLAGGEIGVWHDRMQTSEEAIVRDNLLYPNILAMAERTWQGGGWQYFDLNGTLLPIDPDNEVRKAFDDFERRMLWHKEHTLQGYPFPYVKQTNIHWRITDAFPNNGDLEKKFPPEEELQEEYIYDGKSYATHQADGASIYLRHVWGEKLVPGLYKTPEENHTAYAYTWIYSPYAQNVGALIEFQNYSRSERDLPPLQGQWDYKGSRIWINDAEILPPTWEGTHKNLTNEIPLTNENCTARPPVSIHLNKGWNKVLLKLPVGKFTTPQTRLVKWMFTFVCVTPDGAKAVEGLVYSAEKKL